MSVDPTGKDFPFGGGDFPPLFSTPKFRSDEPSLEDALPSLLGEDQQSSNRTDNPLYSLGGWEADLKKIVSGQESLQPAEEVVDLSLFLALLEQSSGGEKKQDDLDSDLQKFLRGEE